MKRIKCILLSLLVVICAATSAPMSAYAVSKDTMVSKVLSVAQNEVGYEGTSTYSKYGEWYGYQGGWCTTFVIWCFNNAGEQLGVQLYGSIVPLGGNCNSMISWYQNKGRYHTRSSGYTPKKGDLIFFDWSGNGSAQHVGIVKSTSGSTVNTIEGNCSGKVKERTYTETGSAPYNNISAIMGYGAPAWDSVSDGSYEETTEKETTTKAKTTKKHTTEKATSKKETTTKKEEPVTRKKRKRKPTTEPTTKAPEKVENMTIYAATNELQIGDSVKLDYSVTPVNANAVVGYFCDEENVIDLKNDGTITATGLGTATVVVCANDEIYRQIDFIVTEVKAQVTRRTPVGVSDAGGAKAVPAGKKSDRQILAELGINIEKLKSHYEYYIIPLGIIGITALVSFMIFLVKKIAYAVRKRKKD